MAVTDDERREVAERLRRAWTNVPDKNPVRHHMRVLYEIYAAVGLNDDGVDAIDLFDRLADLIEPGPTSSDKAPTFDRNALLALADTLGSASGELCDGCALKDGCAGATCALGVAHEAARRIREALGVVE